MCTKDSHHPRARKALAWMKEIGGLDAFWLMMNLGLDVTVVEPHVVASGQAANIRICDNFALVVTKELVSAFMNDGRWDDFTWEEYLGHP